MRYVSAENPTVNKINTTARSQPGRCIFCWTFSRQNKFHSLQDCEEFKAITGKGKDSFLIHHNLCQSCLEPGHVILNCPNPSEKCSKCELRGGQPRHHPVLKHHPNSHNMWDQTTDLDGKPFTSSVHLIDGTYHRY